MQGVVEEAAVDEKRGRARVAKPRAKRTSKRQRELEAVFEALDPEESAKAAGLRYVSDAKPGIRREKVGEHEFRYTDPHGAEVKDEKTLARIKSLVIPPAWTDVWISMQAGSPGDRTRSARAQAGAVSPQVARSAGREQV